MRVQQPDGVGKAASPAKCDHTAVARPAGQAGPYRQPDAADSVEHDFQIGKIDHHFQHDDIGAGRGHDVGLPCCRAAHLGRRRRIVGPAPIGHAGTYKRTRRIGPVARLDRQFDRTAVVIAETVRLAGIRQRVKMRCEAVADHHLGPGVEIIKMDLADNVRVAERAAAIPGIFQLRDAAPLGFGAGRAVGQDAFARSDPCHKAFIARHRDLLSPALNRCCRLATAVWKPTTGMLPSGSRSRQGCGTRVMLREPNDQKLRRVR